MIVVDEITIKRIETLHPIIREEIKQIYIYINNFILGKGVRLRFSHTSRSFKEQDYLYAQGRTRPGAVVTNAKGGESEHNYHLAFDIVLLYDKDGNGTFETASWDTLFDGDGDGVSDWLEVTQILEKAGYKNGFIRNGKKWDKPHFSKTFGYKVSQLKQLPKDKNGYVIFPN